VSKLSILEPKTLTEAMQFAEVLSKSGILSDDYQGKPSNVLVAIQWGYEVGLAPMQALQNIAVINGKATVWGDSALALVKSHPAFRGHQEWLEGEEAICEIKRRLPNGDIETTRRTFSIHEAKRAGLTNKRGPWQNYPNRMLCLRARGFALRDSFPDALKGIITTEEAMDYEDAEKQSSEKAVQAPVVSSEGDTMQNIVEALSEEPSETEGVKPPEPLLLHLPGKEPIKFDTDLEWASEYADKMLEMRQYEKFTHAERRTKLKLLKELNQETLDKIDPELSTEMEEKRKSYNAALSVEAKEMSDVQSGTNTETATGL